MSSSGTGTAVATGADTAAGMPGICGIPGTSGVEASARLSTVGESDSNSSACTGSAIIFTSFPARVALTFGRVPPASGRPRHCGRVGGNRKVAHLTGFEPASSSSQNWRSRGNDRPKSSILAPASRRCPDNRAPSPSLLKRALAPPGCRLSYRCIFNVSPRRTLLLKPSDDLEVALQFPVGHVFLEFPRLPLARGGVMLHERLAEQFLGGC